MISIYGQVDYKQFPGMYPGAAGKIASHGPYADVKVRYIRSISLHHRDDILLTTTYL